MAREEMRPIRVCFGVDNLNFGGTELNAVRSAERLDRSRFELRVVCLQSEGPLRDRYRSLDVPIESFPIDSLFGRSALVQGMRMARYLRRQRVDIFHAHDLYSNIFSATWARLAGVPGIIASRRWWRASDPRLAWLNRTCSRRADVVLANSERVAELVERTDGIGSDRLAVVRNFVDSDAYESPTPELRRELLDRFDLTGSDRIVGIVGNLRPVKNHAALLHGVALLKQRWPSLRLVIVGDGECRAELGALAQGLGISDMVRFVGRQPPSPNLHHLFDVSVLCSTSEGLSNSILEAMAAGRPVVATDVGASADAVLDGVTGRLVRVGDTAGLAVALDDLLGKPARARTMGEAARRRALHAYSAETALRSLESLYARLAKEPRRATAQQQHGLTAAGA